MLFLQLNPAKPASKILGDKNVRKALYTAIDRQALVDGAAFKQGEVANSFYPPAAFVYNRASNPPCHRLTSPAASMLDCGLDVGLATGIRQKNGVKMSLKFLGQSGNKTHQLIFETQQQ